MDRGRGRGWGRGRRGGRGNAGRAVAGIHRGRGWGNGVHNNINNNINNNNNTWVRPRDEDSEAGNGSYTVKTPKAEPMTTSQGVSATAGTATGPILKGPSVPHTNQTSAGPILRGPAISRRQFPGRGGRYIGRGQFHGYSVINNKRGRGLDDRRPRTLRSNTWRRDTFEKNTDLVVFPSEKRAGTAEDEKTSVLSNIRIDDAAVIPPSKTDNAIEDQFADAPTETNEEESNDEINTDQFADAPDDTDFQERIELLSHEKSDKQVVDLDKEKSSDKNGCISTTKLNIKSSKKKINQGQSKQGKMVHKGSNKLILSTTVEAQQQQQQSAARKRPVSVHNRPIVKRIKIHATAATEPTATSKQIDENGSQGSEATLQKISDKPKSKTEASTSSSNETLTDFAYRETSSSTRGRGGRGHSSRGRGGRGYNLGLVRVNPDQSNTPICPTFLRGIRCENELCRKRHDVPIEAARPVCSFFQRHGQCLRGTDCPFRHVKVSARAMLCPNFNLLGYCDDKQCVMQHVVANKSIKNSRARGKVGNKSDDQNEKIR